MRRSGAANAAVAEVAPIVAPAKPERLPPAPEFLRTAMPAAARRDRATTGLVVRLPGLPAAIGDRGAGIATYDARTGADFTWTSLDAVTATPDGLVVRTATRVRGPLTVTFAATPQWARHGYLTRVDTDTGRAANGELVVDLPVDVGTVQFVLPDGVAHAGPFRLVRVDDPQWLPASESPTGIEVVRGAPATVLLGAGRYELVDPIAAELRQGFAVPTNAPIELSPTLTAARADRP